MIVGYTDVHILNVGAGSCAVIEHFTGHLSMVDVNDGGQLRSYEKEALAKMGSSGLAQIQAEEDELTDPIDWYRAKYGDQSLFRFILSHPDADHMAGIRRILIGVEIDATNFWDVPHKRERTREECQSEAAWQDWFIYDQFRHDQPMAGVTWPRKLNPLRGQSRDYWNSDRIDILSPTVPLIDKCDAANKYNDASYVLRVRHADTGTAVLLPGDAEDPAWNDMLDDPQVDMRAHVLVAAHHGRMNGYNEAAVDRINPNVVIVSTGSLDSKLDAVPEYKRHTEHVFSTRTYGNIQVRMEDDGSFAVSDQAGNQLTRYVRIAA